ncbi:MAG: hypothetical protein MJY59_04450 [Bacteroidaceae bacterium]|nr:hypothetical protein [Bacteroidaceae bacterium]
MAEGVGDAEREECGETDVSEVSKPDRSDWIFLHDLSVLCKFFCWCEGNIVTLWEIYVLYDNLRKKWNRLKIKDIHKLGKRITTVD